ncbi:MAG: chorismate mutase [Oceanospirillaceae bacterium]
MDKLVAMRSEIDVIDKQLISFLGQRFQITERIGLYKADNALPASDENRELGQFFEYRKLALQHDISEELVADIFKRVIEEVILRHKQLIN